MLRVRRFEPLLHAPADAHEYFWPTHRFHHSPTELHWLSGNRASPVHVFLSFGPTAFFMWLFSLGPVAIGVTTFVGVLWNYMMHVNVRFSDRVQRALEYLVTTPRYHHIHHSDAAALEGKNLGSVFTFPDRLFEYLCEPGRRRSGIAALWAGRREAESDTPRHRDIGLSRTSRGPPEGGHYVHVETALKTALSTDDVCANQIAHLFRGNRAICECRYGEPRVQRGQRDTDDMHNYFGVCVLPNTAKSPD